jgi:hypothetical protein
LFGGAVGSDAIIDCGGVDALYMIFTLSFVAVRGPDGM